jgi:hypothetical protein
MCRMRLRYLVALALTLVSTDCRHDDKHPSQDASVRVRSTPVVFPVVVRNLELGAFAIEASVDVQLDYAALRGSKR